MHLLDQKNSSLSVVAVVLAGIVGFSVALSFYLIFGGLLETIAVYYLSALFSALFIGMLRRIFRKRKPEKVTTQPKVDCQFN